MLAKTSKLLISFAVFFYIWKWLFFWLYETTDSYFYWAFAEFIRTGKYIVPHPYYWTIPSTLGAPVYSVFLYLAQFINRADIIIHLVQILCIIVSGFLLYKILQSFLQKSTSLIITSFFLLTPSNIFHSSTLWTESLAISAATYYFYLVFLILNQKKEHLLPYLVIFSSVITLVRYNFVTYFALSLFLLLINLVKERKRPNQHPGIMVKIVSIAIALTVIASWLLINHTLNGSWGLSDSQGKNLYNRVLGWDKLEPPSDNANWQTLQKLTKSHKERLKETYETQPSSNLYPNPKQSLHPVYYLFQPSYNIEPFILKNFNNSVAKESEFFGKIALSAAKNHPLAYIKNTFTNWFLIHGNGLPYPDDLFTYSKWMGSGCRILGKISFCKAVIDTQFAAKVWNFIAGTAQPLYFSIPALLNLFVLFPALFYALIQKKVFVKFAAIAYMLGILTVVIPESPVFRYAYPLLPIKFILCSYFIHHLIQFLLKSKAQVKKQS